MNRHKGTGYGDVNDYYFDLKRLSEYWVDMPHKCAQHTSLWGYWGFTAVFQTLGFSLTDYFSEASTIKY